jgi:hypothetical protein
MKFILIIIFVILVNCDVKIIDHKLKKTHESDAEYIQSVKNFWTKERMLNAKPIDIRINSQIKESHSKRISYTDYVPNSFYPITPYKMVGKIFFKDESGASFVCRY